MMKYLYSPVFFLFISLGLIVSCNSTSKEESNNTASEEQATEQNPEIAFEKTVHDFGKIFKGERVAYSFRFANEGNSPLVISAVRSGCGCTVGDYPKDPVKPGETGKIDVVFNSAGRNGFQSESVRVLNNSSESALTLRITAEVIDQ
jgi:hypothetical protein